MIVVNFYIVILIYIIWCTVFILGKTIKEERYQYHYGFNRFDIPSFNTKQNENEAAAFPILLVYGNHDKRNEMECHIWEPLPAGSHCVSFNCPVYELNTEKLLWHSNTSWHMGYILDHTINPHIPKCPVTLGRLTLDSSTGTFACSCTTYGLFSGPHCDQPTDKLIKVNKCKRVGWLKNPTIVDITRFDPARDGLCIECSIPNAVPILDSKEPTCHSMLSLPTTNPQITKPLNNPCIYDALTGKMGSPLNHYVSGYGCSCDYYNGYVEIYIPGLDSITKNTHSSNVTTSNACIKIGKSPDPLKYHRTDILFHTLVNGGKPFQTHTYEQVEPLFTSLINKRKILMIDQHADYVAHSHDWLNRNVNWQTLIRRWHDGDDWPVVHKYQLRNIYKRRDYTIPISALDLKVGRGYETKHWYELTDSRHIQNAIWGHPIVYGSKGDWSNQCTLNPIGVMEGYYAGITILISPGQPVRLDTRWIDPKNFPLVIPPQYDVDMVSDKEVEMYFDAPYIPMLYMTYTI